MFLIKQEENQNMPYYHAYFTLFVSFHKFKFVFNQPLYTNSLNRFIPEINPDYFPIFEKRLQAQLKST